MIRNYILLVLTVLTLNSCGKSEKEIKQEKIHEQKVNVGKRKKITELNIQLQKLPEAIKKANSKIAEISRFKIGRSKTEKEWQLNQAYEKLSELYSYEKKLKNEIAQLEYLKTFEFQKEPKKILEYIFDSCKRGDFSDFRNLCDPYGENDSDINRICFAELLTKKQQKEFQNTFKNGRIIGETKFYGKSAVVEFAIGINADKLKKMTFIQRNELWYLSNF